MGGTASVFTEEEYTTPIEKSGVHRCCDFLGFGKDLLITSEGEIVSQKKYECKLVKAHYKYFLKSSRGFEK